MDVGSVNSLHNLPNCPLPTSPEENNGITIKRLSYVLGFLYSMFLIIFALLVYTFSETLLYNQLPAVITIYIVVSGLILLCVLMVDVKQFTRKIRRQVNTIRLKEEELELNHLREFDESTEYNGTRNNDEYEPNASFVPRQQEMEHIDHHYCFARGRHAGSVYLKFGAAAFALGHFVHGVLLVVVVHLSLLIQNTNCINGMEYVADLLQSIYCFAQLFFIFNYSNLIIMKHANLARLAFLHIMAGNVCLWISAVSTETKLAYKAYEWVQINKNESSANDRTNIDLKDDNETLNCKPTLIKIRIFEDYSAYLYPFTVEFNILIVGIFFMLWRNIGKCRHSTEEVREFQHSLYAHTNISGEVNSPRAAMDIHINCRNTINGLFASLFVIVLLVVSIILGFVFGSMGNESFEYLGHIFEDSIKLLFHTTMLIATAVAFFDISKLAVPWLDDVLLYICVPAFFLETMFTVIAVVNILNVVKLLDTIVMSLQMIVQIAFVIDGLRRCSNSRKLRRTKPGRELVLFLLVCNVSMWVLYTFSYKSPESKDVRYQFYGKKVWLAVGHICAPLIMFFRFHSSVCIADIWSYAYKPGIEDH